MNHEIKHDLCIQMYVVMVIGHKTAHQWNIQKMKRFSMKYLQSTVEAECMVGVLKNRSSHLITSAFTYIYTLVLYNCQSPVTNTHIHTMRSSH